MWNDKGWNETPDPTGPNMTSSNELKQSQSSLSCFGIETNPNSAGIEMNWQVNLSEPLRWAL